MKKVVLILSLLVLGVFMVNADTNGVWHYAKDFRDGIFGSDEGATQFIFNSSLQVNEISEFGDRGIQFKNSSDANTLFIATNGNVGIGTSTPSQALDVNGNVEATAYYHDSDRRLKKNIEVIENPIEIVRQLEGVNFEWKENDKKTIGLIAQDVEKVIPEIVNTKEDGYKSVEYANLVALLIEVVKEQQIQIDDLKDKIE